MKRASCALLIVAVSSLFTPLAVSAGTTSPRPLTVLPPAPAAAPSPVTATIGNGSIALKWPAVAGATAYHVFRGTGGSWDSTPVARVSGLHFRNYGLTNGTTYSFRVSAFNAGGDGPASNIVSGTPLGVPAGVVATPGDTKVTVSWPAVAGANGYSVYRGTTSTFTSMVMIAAGIGELSFVDTGLTNGTLYYYRLRAHAVGGVSAPSHAVSAKPQPPPPASAPGGLTATPGNAFVVLNWTAVANATGYRIFRSTNGNWDAPAIANVTGTTYKNTGLANGTAYAFKVAAKNAGGTGPLSGEVTATPMAIPAAPGGVTATGGDRLVTLSWTPVANATSYNVYRGTRPGREAAVAVGTLGAPPFADRSVENGPTYYYKVTAANVGGESPRSLEVSATPEGPPLVVDPATAAAFQFLRQATWGPRPGDVDAIKSIGKDAFLASQLATPPAAYPDMLYEKPVEAAQEFFMSLAMTGPDQLRQRVAWALHKIWVVSAVEVPDPRAIIIYHRLLQSSAFGNYRDLMRDMTLNPAMGRYLNMLNNRSQAVTGSLPNENYARELMQLFTVGIPILTPGGVPVVDGTGRPVPVYTEQDVKELARIFTGWTFGDGNSATTPRNLARENWVFPMEAVERFHDTGPKTFLGQSFPANQTARQDLDQALDLLFNHPNVGPFVARQIIQQLVTSNPSPGYVAAVAAAFNDNGGGVRGDLAAVVRTTLTHPEASMSTLTSGKLAEPVLFVVSILRALNASVTDHPFMSDKTEAMGQRVLYPPSVFSYFSPGYRVRGTAGAGGAPIGGPEFQILTTVTALERANFVGDLLGGHYGNDVAIDYTPFTSRAGDAAVLVDYCNLVFMGGRMSAEMRTEIVNAVRRSPSTSAGERVKTALYLTLIAAQSQVDR